MDVLGNQSFLMDLYVVVLVMGREGKVMPGWVVFAFVLLHEVFYQLLGLVLSEGLIRLIGHMVFQVRNQVAKHGGDLPHQGADVLFSRRDPNMILLPLKDVEDHSNVLLVNFGPGNPKPVSQRIFGVQLLKFVLQGVLDPVDFLVKLGPHFLDITKGMVVQPLHGHPIQTSSRFENVLELRSEVFIYGLELVALVVGQTGVAHQGVGFALGLLVQAQEDEGLIMFITNAGALQDLVLGEAAAALGNDHRTNRVVIIWLLSI